MSDLGDWGECPSLCMQGFIPIQGGHYIEEFDINKDDSTGTALRR
jgi:hypothetical protein